ncbi:hypothetical protein BD311DRAFT_771201 [Dichomitus squalens]|uniref:Uncharacterized protein n=1 Tax=Dichomitus squalens TaxID=114155 RepID=A0A4V2JYP9_9APHY|nr:hypothetical protein BD311DRAFT_771201 [Dichomitus squalens]
MLSFVRKEQREEPVIEQGEVERSMGRGRMVCIRARAVNLRVLISVRHPHSVALAAHPSFCPSPGPSPRSRSQQSRALSPPPPSLSCTTRTIFVTPRRKLFVSAASRRHVPHISAGYTCRHPVKIKVLGSLMASMATW